MENTALNTTFENSIKLRQEVLAMLNAHPGQRVRVRRSGDDVDIRVVGPEERRSETEEVSTAPLSVENLDRNRLRLRVQLAQQLTAH